MFINALGDNETIKEARKMIVEDSGVKAPSMSAMAIPLSRSATVPAVERSHNFLPVIVDNLGTELPLPEDYVISQDDEPTGND